MDKAIEIFRKIKTQTIMYDEKELDDAIAFLQAHKAKIDSLKSRCKSQIEEQKKNFYDSARGKVDAYADILQKLEELDK